jgi:hypothetical protein
MSIPRSGSSIPGMRIEAYPSGSGHYLNSPGAVAHMCPTRNTPSTCPIDSILLEFLSSRQNLAAQGEPSAVVVGPPYPSVSSLLNPEKKIKAHPLTRVFTDILGSFEMLSKLPEQVAVLYVMFLVMRVCCSLCFSCVSGDKPAKQRFLVANLPNIGELR